MPKPCRTLSLDVSYYVLAMTLKNFSLDDGDDKSLKSVSEIGSMLFTRGVSGTRVVTGREEKIFQGNHVFKGKFKINKVYWQFMEGCPPPK